MRQVALNAWIDQQIVKFQVTLDCRSATNNKHNDITPLSVPIFP
jgi:hypothetical protein